MKRLSRNLVSIAIVLCLCVLAGAPFLIWWQAMRAKEAPLKLRRMNHLLEFGLAYREYCREHRVPPSSLNSLSAYHNRYPNALQEVQNGPYVVFWDTLLGDNDEENARRIVLHEAQVPEQGGFVLFGDNVCRRVSASEFAELIQDRAR